MSNLRYAYWLEAIEDFLIYNENDVCQDEIKIMENIIYSVSKYLNEEEIRKIQKAYIYAAQAHLWQKRLSGEDYIIHPLKATQILLTLKPDATTIQACILHDVIEDTPITYADILKDFGKEVADLCEGLVKVSKVRYQGEDRQIETLKKTFLAMASDLRVIFIKIADRIHNIQTLHFHPKEEKKQRIALETLKIYVPICKKLGLYQFQLYLENGVFKILHPDDYDQVIGFLKKKYAHADRDIIKGKIKLEKLLSKSGFSDFSITWRVKSPYRIYEKLIKKHHHLDFSKVLDVMAFRVVVDTIPECYNVLWIIHSAYNPLINKIKDYIAVPKFNDYQSLHTTILGLYPFPTEIQIRTKDMHSIAEFGVAAHILYKDNNETIQNTLTQRQSERLMNLQTSVKKYQTQDKKNDFEDKLSIELLDNNIFIYTPKWDVIELSKGSTVLDFAFRIHTDVGLRFNNATVNGVIKPIGYELKSGDVVAINTFKNKYTATKYWIDYLHTPTAKSKLLRHIKHEEKEVYVNKGIWILDAKLTKYDLPLIASDKDKIKKHYGEQLEHMLMQVASKAVTPMSILKQIYNIAWEKPNTTIDIKKEETKLSDTYKVLIDDSKLLLYDLCPLCAPKPWQKIIARSGKDGIKIHTMECKGVQTISLEKFIKAKREQQEDELYHFDIEVTIENKNINLISLLSILQDLGITIDSVKIEKPSDSLYLVYICFSHINPSKIGYVISYIQKNYADIISTKTKIT